jgi:hypothetical protein
MKVLSVFEKENSESSESDDEVEIQPQPKSKQNHEFAITDANIQEVESQMLILQSLIESKPVASNIKELVDLLKKVHLLLNLGRRVLLDPGRRALPGPLESPPEHNE